MLDTSQPAFKQLRGIIAERTMPTVFWVGSGLSQPAGLPLWTQLTQALHSAASNKADSLDDVSRAYHQRKLAEATRLPPWDALSRYRESLGESSYVSQIRDLLTPAVTARVPEAYRLIWKLRPSGLVSLNLDRLATRAYVEHHSTEPNEFVGEHVARYTHLLQSPTRPFIANLHGVLDDSQSWVLTRDDLQKLLNLEAYQSFVSTLIQARVIVFVGLSADDVAVGGFLEDIQRQGLSGLRHFWITSRIDDSTDRWASRLNLQVIRYKAPSNNHAELLDLLRQIASFVSRDTAPGPAYHGIDPHPPHLSGEIPGPDELAAQRPERIREILNAEAGRILTPLPDKSSYAEYNAFCKKYRRAIHNAWYYTLEEPDNTVLGYVLEEELGRGGFGRVFRAIHTLTNEQCAVKVLWEEARDSAEILGSFRRGVRSMQILSRHKVPGMVAYRGATEIPALAIMDYVPGPNLKDAVVAGYIGQWSTRLEIALALSQTIRTAHKLPERVLHRDIRPANVMLRDFYSRPERLDVVVLDFDLSWHKDASEKSIAINATTHGYLAPEQLAAVRGASTRSATVDSFGFGMTLFYVCAGRDPAPMEHASRNWEAAVYSATESPVLCTWKSLNARVARAILASTRQRQSERWDMGQIESELSRLWLTTLEPEECRSAELWAEEVAARLDVSLPYQWNGDRFSALFRLPSGLKLELRGDESTSALVVSIDWAEPGHGDRRRISKYLPKAVAKVQSSLGALGFRLDTDTSSASAFIGGTLPIATVRSKPDEVVIALGAAAGAFSFE